MKTLSVITRTKDRPVTLRRSLESVSCQTSRDFEWVIVNDAGDPTVVDEVAALARERGIEVRVITRAASVGADPALNHGIRESIGRYVTIHDDDDTWEPTFVETMTRTLEHRSGAGFGGVMCGVTKIIERIDGDTITELSRTPYQAMFHNVSIATVATGLLFIVPGCLVYTREVYDKLGGYREDIELQSDWDFHVRFLLESDIWLIPESLFNYHVRKQDGSAYGNSVTASVVKHRNFRAKVLNEFWRSALKTEHGPMLMAMATNFGAPVALGSQAVETVSRWVIRGMDHIKARRVG